MAGRIKRLFQWGRQAGKTLAGLRETEDRIREVIDLEPEVENRLEAVQLSLEKRAKRNQVKARKYRERRARGPKRRVRTLERYRDRAVLGRATADNFRSVVEGME